MSHTSILTMVTSLGGMADTKDLSDWENEFVKSVTAKIGAGKDITVLSDKQVEKVEQIYNKHFG